MPAVSSNSIADEHVRPIPEAHLALVFGNELFESSPWKNSANALLALHLNIGHLHIKAN
jgi:hypothetical protein